jgi:hypothetical protein
MAGKCIFFKFKSGFETFRQFQLLAISQVPIKQFPLQEAFKAVEDIYSMMQLAKKTPKPQLLANYYQKTALVFWKSRNYLYHAAALQRLFVLCREQKKAITSEELQK